MISRYGGQVRGARCWVLRKIPLDSVFAFSYYTNVWFSVCGVRG